MRPSPGGDASAPALLDDRALSAYHEWVVLVPVFATIGPQVAGKHAMETAVTTSPPIDEAEVEAVLARLSEQMREVREQMQADDIEIARLKAESAELRSETRAIRARLQATK